MRFHSYIKTNNSVIILDHEFCTYRRRSEEYFHLLDESEKPEVLKLIVEIYRFNMYLLNCRGK